MAKLTLKRGNRTYTEVARWAFTPVLPGRPDRGMFVLRSDGFILRRIDEVWDEEGGRWYGGAGVWREYAKLHREVAAMPDAVEKAERFIRSCGYEVDRVPVGAKRT